MISYIKMKTKEYELKYIFYSSIISIIKEQKNIVDIMQKLYIALKDVPIETLRDELTSKIAELIHAENHTDMVE